MLYFYSGTDREKARTAMGAALKSVAKSTEIIRISDANTAADLRSAIAGGGMFGDKRVVILDGVSANEEMHDVLFAALPQMSKSKELFFVLEEKPDAATRKNFSPNSRNCPTRRGEGVLRSNMRLSDTFSVSTNNEYCHCGFCAGLYHCCMNRRGFAVLVLLVLGVVPFVTNAQVNIAQGEDVRCSIECAIAARNGNPCPGTVIACKVAIPGSNTVWGICMLSGCKGQTYTGLGGGSTGVGDIGGIVGQIFKGLLDKIMQPKPSSGGGGGGTPATAAGCTTYYTVTVPSSDPCATYVQPTSSSLLGGTSGTQGTASQALLDALNGGTQSSVNTALGIGGDGGTSTANVSAQILNQAANQNTNTALQTQDANTNINTVLQTQGATTNTNQNQTTASSATGTLA